MPYIITTTAPGAFQSPIPGWSSPERVTRRAVATLDEARDYAWQQAGWTPDAPDVPGGIHDIRRESDGFNVHTGGTIGPLPDGTVINVERVT